MHATTQSTGTVAVSAGTLAPHPIALGDAGVLRPGRLRWLRACGWAIVLFFLVAVPTGVLTRFLGGF
ncbi:hypothetical protein [Xanthomonas pisi]|uniref:hypothetical protein n=1 Tax=Xanthomonas pisi TaxID=56457 RepID=UPI000A622671|nr:hypothetical protein [Xanthomonas pisi]